MFLSYEETLKVNKILLSSEKKISLAEEKIGKFENIAITTMQSVKECGRRK